MDPTGVYLSQHPISLAQPDASRKPQKRSTKAVAFVHSGILRHTASAHRLTIWPPWLVITDGCSHGFAPVSADPTNVFLPLWQELG